MNQLIITHMPLKQKECIVMALVNDSKVCQMQLMDKACHSLLGTIHVGKVQRVLPNIKGAFVEIENHLPCYYSCSKNDHPFYTGSKKGTELKAGDELMVQVTQEAIKTKAPTVSSNISLQGKYLVLITENRKIGISSKLSGAIRSYWKEKFQDWMTDDCDFGMILRTNAADATEEQVYKEFLSLRQEWETLKHRAMHTPPFTLLKDSESPVLLAVKNTRWELLEKIVTDDADFYRQLQNAGTDLPVSATIEWYQDPLLPLYKLYRLEHELERGLQEKVWLKSGGFLIIQQTEACVVIDVNSGKNMKKQDAEKAYRQINLEAAQEIARQMRLRNLSGMILIDFINLNQKEDQEELLHELKKLVKDDSVPTTVVDITGLHIVELTRKKERQTLAEQAATILRAQENGV